MTPIAQGLSTSLCCMRSQRHDLDSGRTLVSSRLERESESPATLSCSLMPGTDRSRLVCRVTSAVESLTRSSQLFGNTHGLERLGVAHDGAF